MSSRSALRHSRLTAWLDEVNVRAWCLLLAVIVMLEVALLLHSDAAAASGRRQLAAGQQQQVVLMQPAGQHGGSVSSARHGGTHPPGSGAAASQPEPAGRGKVALLFLTQGRAVPLEPIWRLFLSSLDGAGGWQAWFSVYSHPPPGATFPAGSLFAGTEVPGRVRVEWGQPSVVRPPPLCGAD